MEFDTDIIQIQQRSTSGLTPHQVVCTVTRYQVYGTWYMVRHPRGSYTPGTRYMLRYADCYLWNWPHQKTNQFVRSYHPCASPPRRRLLTCRMQPTLHVTPNNSRRFALGASGDRLVGENPTCSVSAIVEMRGGVYGHTTTAMHNMSTPPPLPPPPSPPPSPPPASFRRYFIPADGDDPAHPNVFQLPSGLVGSGSVRCADVEKYFPLPGRYHFRFKKKFRDAFGG